MKILEILLSIFSIFSISISAQNKLIPFNNLQITYEGRILFRDNSAELSWPGTTVGIQFEGASISALLQDFDTANYYNVVVDGEVFCKFHTDTLKRSYLLADNLSLGKHYVQLFKRTEWDKGKTLFYGFETSINTVILTPPPPKSRKIEFYGNSISCGYANEDSSSNDSWHGFFENNYLTYAAIVARHYDAQYYNNSKSGIGILVSWFPLIMPEMYDRLDPLDSLSKWDFTKYTPDIVVINLFQNDCWLTKMPEHEQFKYRFGNTEPTKIEIITAYQNFVATIRGKYPNTSIICALGSMDATREGSPWPGYIIEAVQLLNDAKIYTHFFEYNNTTGHPRIAEQQNMAQSLINFIDNNIKW